MPTWSLWAEILKRPILSLIGCFTLWKTLLFAVALASPGPGYDTSTTLLRPYSTHIEGAASKALSPLGKLVRWDAIYFTQIAHRGVVFEQEWAFGLGFPKLLACLARGLNYFGQLGPLHPETLAGLILAHGLHLLSCLTLYQLSWTVYPTISHTNRSQFSFLAASLHIISPAGVFLSAPYAESSFSFLNFLGFFLFTKSLDEHSGGRAWSRDLLVLASGLTLGVATTVRGNGLLSGLLYCFEGMREITKLSSSSEIVSQIRRLGFILAGGGLMAICAAVPHFIAYLDYCVEVNESETRRPWCSHRIPSIYAWVQSHYWNVGFLKYWTLSNLPLFILATPMLLIMTFSSMEIWTLDNNWAFGHTKDTTHPENSVEMKLRSEQCRGIVQRLAFPQMILAILALTTYHVQIITRLSSGYPVWYWWLASMILSRRELSFLGKKWNIAEGIVKWMVLYALIQGGLFACFLPPA